MFSQTLSVSVRKQVSIQRWICYLQINWAVNFSFIFGYERTHRALKSQENTTKSEPQDLHPRDSKMGNNFEENAAELLGKKKITKTEPQRATEYTS